MRLFGRVNGAIDRFDRAEWLTPPFDLGTYWPPEVYDATLRITQAVAVGVLAMAETMAVSLVLCQRAAESLILNQETAVELAACQDVGEDLALCQTKAVELER